MVLVLGSISCSFRIANCGVSASPSVGPYLSLWSGSGRLCFRGLSHVENEHWGFVVLRCLKGKVSGALCK